MASKAKKKTTSRRQKPSAKKAARRSGGDDGSAGRVAEIQRLIDVMVAAGAVEVEMEENGSRLRVRLKEDPPLAVMPYGAPPSGAVAPVAAGAVLGQAADVPASPAADSDTFVFSSPMVGTFYRAPSPETEAFVRVGQEVTADTTLCILEAMKVMNEIKAEVDGVIVEVLAENGESIEFGQPLFVLRSV